MGKNNNGLVYLRLINETVLYLLQYTGHVMIDTVLFVFDSSMQNHLLFYILVS